MAGRPERRGFREVPDVARIRLEQAVFVSGAKSTTLHNTCYRTLSVILPDLAPQHFRDLGRQFGRRKRLLQECKVAIQLLDVFVGIP